MISRKASNEIIQQALEMERMSRFQTVQGYALRGDLTIIPDCQPKTISVQVEDEVFTDLRDKFPSVELTAKVALAIASGLSERNRVHDEFDAAPPQTHHLYGGRYRGGKSNLRGWLK